MDEIKRIDRIVERNNMVIITGLYHIAMKLRDYLCFFIFDGSVDQSKENEYQAEACRQFSAVICSVFQIILNDFVEKRRYWQRIVVLRQFRHGGLHLIGGEESLLAVFCT